MLFGLCQRSDKAQTEQRSGGPASLLAIVPGIVICRCHVATCYALFMRGTAIKHAGHGFKVWIATSRAC